NYWTFNLFLFLFFLRRSSLSEQVLQTPADIYSRPGEPAKIRCLHTSPSYNRILWYKQSKRQLQFLGYVNYNDGYPETGVNVTMEGSSGALTVKDLQLEDSAVYFCAVKAYFGGGTKLTVLVKVLPPSTKECRNQKDGPRKKTIVCVASGFYPDHVSVKWKIDGIKATSGVATDNAALQEGGYYRITSRLKVSGEDWFTLYKNFTCIVEMSNKKSLCPVCCSVQLENGTTES
uniref:Ig-like domain-containing protein n=1 Tax=Sander lucioperca TaxID=283035 RepID=A0A8D0A164_SANLU